MANIWQPYKHEIEIERLWFGTGQNNLAIIGGLSAACMLVIGLWDLQPHTTLICWLAIITSINVLKWILLNHYHDHKEVLVANIRRFKQLLLLLSLMTGLSWGSTVFLFMNPSQPASVMIISILLFLDCLGIVITYFCYLPTMMILVICMMLPLIATLLVEGDNISLCLAFIFLLFTICGPIASFKIAGMLNNALRLNFENADLRRESEGKSRLLEQTLAEAEQANAAKTRFLATASHDLRQPIHALGLFFAELSDRVYSPDTALVIGQVEDSIAAINSMLNALLDVSKLDAGIVKPAIEPVALSDLFARLQAEFQPIALENHNKLRIRPALAIVNTDPAMLDRMLRNLIGNALRYTENGRILVAARPSTQSALFCRIRIPIS